MPTNLTPEIINAAILGFEQQKARIDDHIAELRAMMSGGTKPTPAATPEATTAKRKISAAERRRMALGQQKRWAAIKGTTESSHAATPEPLKPKRMLSAAGKAAIVAATKARWDRVRAEAAKTKPAAKNSATKTAVAKRKLSPARKAALVANLAKARAAKAAKATAGAR